MRFMHLVRSGMQPIDPSNGNGRPRVLSVVVVKALFSFSSLAMVLVVLKIKYRERVGEKGRDEDRRIDVALRRLVNVDKLPRPQKDLRDGRDSIRSVCILPKPYNQPTLLSF